MGKTIASFRGLRCAFPKVGVMGIMGVVGIMGGMGD